MTPTERIAVELLGWRESSVMERDGSRPWYQWSRSQSIDGVEYLALLIGESKMPDLTNWNDIRRMEDVLAERGLLLKYNHQLYTVCMDSEMMEFDGVAAFVALRASATQRVAACIAVLDEIKVC